jgi:hypothetical protein
LSRVWVTLVAATIGAEGAWIVYQGFVDGPWLVGLFYGGVLPAGTIYEWLRLRGQDERVRDAVDQLIVPVMLLLGGLAMY